MPATFSSNEDSTAPNSGGEAEESSVNGLPSQTSHGSKYPPINKGPPIIAGGTDAQQCGFGENFFNQVKNHPKSCRTQAADKNIWIPATYECVDRNGKVVDEKKYSGYKQKCFYPTPEACREQGGTVRPLDPEEWNNRINRPDDVKRCYQGLHPDTSNFDDIRFVRDIKYIVVHVVQGSARSMLNVAASGGTSAHYTFCNHASEDRNDQMCEDGEIIQIVPDQWVAHHAGLANDVAIGLEHSGYIDREFSDATVDSSARLVAKLCVQYDVQPWHITGRSCLRAQGDSPKDDEFKGSGVVAHVDVHHLGVPNYHGTHTDPGPNWPWEEYMSKVRQYYVEYGGSESNVNEDPWACRDGEQPAESQHGNESHATADNDEPQTEAENVHCRQHTELTCVLGRDSCTNGFHAGECPGDTWCCKPEAEAEGESENGNEAERLRPVHRPVRREARNIANSFRNFFRPRD